MARLRSGEAECSSETAGLTLSVHVTLDGMGFLLFLARSFINTFGITQPGPEGERRAAWFIGILLALIAMGMVALLAAFVHMRH